MVRSHPPKPTYALEVGVIGNRRFGDDTLPKAARKAFDEVWAVIHRAFVDALEIPVPVPEHPAAKLKDFFNNDPARLAVLSNLAAGADQIGVDAALALANANPRVKVKIEAIIPFLDDYPASTGAAADDFTAEEAKNFHRLCGDSKSEQVTRLDGRYRSRPQEPFNSPHNESCRHRAYRQAAEVLLQNADLVVAAYNPFATAGPAGTVETIQAALGLSLPVLAILVTPRGTRIALHLAQDRQFVDPELDWEAALPLESEPWKEQLRRRVQYLVALPHLLEPEGGKEDPQAAEVRQSRLEVTVQRLRLYFGDAPLHDTCLMPALSSFLGDVWRSMHRIAAFCAPGNGVPAAPAEESGFATTPALQRYGAHYRHASDLSDGYMRIYRGSFVLAFALASGAVAAAVALMAAAMFAGGTPPVGIVAVLGGLKIAILAALLHLEKVGHEERHQEHAADFRHLAELLRPMPWLARLGTIVPTVEVPPHYAPLDPRQGWTNWLFRALTRAEPSVASTAGPALQLDQGKAGTTLKLALTQWIDDQIAYHERNARQMHRLERGLETLGKGLLWTVLTAAIIAVGLELWMHAKYFHGMSIVLSALAAALPAFIAALAGILSQAEAKRLSLRSEAMAGLLRERRQKLEKFDPHPLGGDAWETAQRLRSLAGIMVSETVDWRALYQLHEVKAG